MTKLSINDNEERGKETRAITNTDYWHSDEYEYSAFLIAKFE